MDVARLRALLGGADTRWIVERLHARLEQRDSAGLSGSVTLRTPSDAEREAVARLFGRPVARAAAITVRIEELDGLLRVAGVCDGLRSAVEELAGPVSGTRARRAAVEAVWAETFAAAGERATASAGLQTWFDDVWRSGLVRRLARGDAAQGNVLLEQAFRLAERLPASGIPIAELAALVAGHSHALDRGEPLGTLALRLVRSIGSAALSNNRGDRRDMWSSVGVLCDELSAPVLTLNLRDGSSSPTGRMLAAHADEGEPYRLSTRQQLRSPPDFRSWVGRTVYVCENPTVVASAASTLGKACAPLVCVEGQPKTAAHLLLRELSAAGTCLLYHGDFDWGGVRIANAVIRRYGALPWRYETVDYLATQAGSRLAGAPVAAVWDEHLEGAMLAARRAVHEEQVLADLLADLQL